jgi:chromosome segregation ATPase
MPLVRIAFLTLLLLGTFIALGQADDTQEATTESRLRDALRNTAQQLQDAQGQVATLQASQAQSDTDNAALKAKVDALTAQIATLKQQSDDDKAASDKAIADLKSQNADLTGQIAKLQDALIAWEKDDKANRQIGTNTEAARAQLAIQIILLKRTIDDRETKNLALYNLGNEILTRYEKYGMGEAITAKEPFTGLSRVKLQELVQDYKDKIADQLVTPGQAPTTPLVKTAGTPTPSSATPSAEKKTSTQ